jgi:hypothetical protein
MFDWLISLLIVIILVLYILDYLGVLEIVSAFVSLGAIALTSRLMLRLFRHLFGANAPKSQA